MLRRTIVFCAGFSIVFLACRHQPEVIDPGSGGGGSGGGGSTPCDPTKIYFQQQVLPILLSNCAMSGCHDPLTHEEGIILNSYNNVMGTTEVRPGNPSETEIYKVLVTTDPDKIMPPPPRSPLSADQVSIIRNWILQGAKDLTCDNLCDSTVFTYNGAIRPMITNKCQGCHSGAGAGGGVDLTTYLNVKARVTDGKLWGSVNHDPGYAPMPKNTAKLSSCELTQVRKWIDAGAPNN
jgi:hypothetical protein